MLLNMILIAGLGNPGEKFKGTRHNIGFKIIDHYQKENHFPDFQLKEKFKSLLSSQGNIILAKPQTFMNSSGKALKKLSSYFEIEKIIVVHDDFDLNLGEIRISKNRGSGGHKGINSIMTELGNDFTRVRIGIKPEKKIENLEKFVLKKFKKKERKLLKPVLERGRRILDTIIDKGSDKAMNRFN